MASGNFENCLPIILRFEGGKSNDPADPGGRTNRGITQRTYDAYRGGKGEPHADVYAIADAEVADCYRCNYWAAVNGDLLRPGEDLVVFDLAVNSGPARALNVWNAAGGATAAQQDIIRAVCSQRLIFMQSLSTWPRFGPGWARRVAQVQQYGLAMADGKSPAVKPKVKPAHAGSAVIVAGGAAAAGAHWFGSPWILPALIVAAAVVLAVYLWSAITKATQMTAARAHPPPQTPAAPAPASSPASNQAPAHGHDAHAPMPADGLDAAMIKVSAAKGWLADAIASVLKERDALAARVVAMQTAVAGAEARLAAMGVDIVPVAPGAPVTAAAQPPAAQPADHGPEQVAHLKADDLIAAPPLIGHPANG